MASRKRSRRPLGSPHRKRRSLLPLLENLENRLVLSQGIRSAGAPQHRRASPRPAPLPGLAPDNGLVPVPLASGGTAWMQRRRPRDCCAGQPGLIAGGAVRTRRNRPVRFRRDPRQSPGRLPLRVGPQPSRSPAPPATSRSRSRPPTGSVPASAYNNNITFGAIKGDGTGQTIGIFEEGYNPAFVDTSGTQLQHQRPGGLRQDLRPARPAQPDLRRPHRHTAVVHQQQQQQPRLRRLRRRHRDRAGHRVGACHGARGQASSSSPPLRTPTTTSRTSSKAWRRWPACPASRWSRPATAGSSISSASESLEQTWDSTILQPASRPTPT